MTCYYCTESEKVISISEIREIYDSENSLQAEYTFPEYVDACQWWNGGTLVPVEKNLDKLPAIIWAINLVFPFEYTTDETIEVAQNLSKAEIKILFSKVEKIESGEYDDD